MAEDARGLATRVVTAWLGGAPAAAVEASWVTALERAIQQIQDKWPRLAVREEAVVEVLAARLAPQACTLTAQRVPELYLTQQCARGNDLALRIFDEEYLARVPASIRRVSDDPDFVDEVLQTLRERLLVARASQPARIDGFVGQGSLHAWVRVAAVRTALNQARGQRQTMTDDDALFALIVPEDDPELVHMKTRYQAIFKTAFTAALGSLEVSKRNVLRLHLVDRLTTDEIGKMYRIHRVTAFRRIDNARQSLANAVRNELTGRWGIPDAEVTGVMQLIRSQIDLSVERLLV